MENKLVYLAAPYSHPDANVRQARFETCCKVAGELLKRGSIVYCPIVSSHPVAVHCRLPGTWDFWKPTDLFFLGLSRQMWVLTLDGWQYSQGLEAEMKHADALGIQVVYVKKEDFGL